MTKLMGFIKLSMNFKNGFSCGFMFQCAVHVRKYLTNKSVITLNYQHAQKDIDSGGGAEHPPKNMTMQIKDGNGRMI